MIVCLCKGVSCSTVRRAIACGAETLDEVGRACGAGTVCGSCHSEVQHLLRDARDARDARAEQSDERVFLPLFSPSPA